MGKDSLPPCTQEELAEKKYSKEGLERRLAGEVFECDRSQFRTDVCNMRGDIRLNSINHSFVLYAVDGRTPLGEEKVKPYTRKWEKSCMDTVHEVTLQSVPSSSLTSAIKCDVQHTVPGVVFSTGGYTGNLYHEFHDGLIPLFITTQHLKREVVFLISELHEWWIAKYNNVIQEMTNYPLIDFEKESQVHCFPELTVGLHIHGEQSIDPTLMPDHKTIWDFQALLSHAYKLPPSLEEEKKQSLKAPPSYHAKVMPQLTILVRQGTRVLLNIGKIVQVAQKVGFRVKLLKPHRTTELQKVFWLLHKSDVLMGVHGAALTHFLFMRPGSVFIQIIPIGTDWAAFTYYGEPATKLGLQYLPYEIEAAESTLSDKYNSTDPILTDPATVVNKGWWEMKKIYLQAQDLRPSLLRMHKLLQKAKSLIRP
ncbi:hypothetical protein BDL97_01G135000 [Sphagnum fallax]|nr:hypothetical protein BDL97_01G135000 [Sphagnum fallax]